MRFTSIRVETGFNACFSSDELMLAIRLSDGGASLYFTRDPVRDRVQALPWKDKVPQEVAVKFIQDVHAILEKSQCQDEGNRCTTRYYAKVYEMDDAMSPLVSVSSNTLPRECLQEVIVAPSTDRDTKTKFQKILDAGYHFWAPEIYSVTAKFFEEFIQKLSEPASDS